MEKERGGRWRRRFGGERASGGARRADWGKEKRGGVCRFPRTFSLPGERKGRLDERLTGAEAEAASSRRIVGGGGQRRRLPAPRRIHEKYIECDGNARRTCCNVRRGRGVGRAWGGRAGWLRIGHVV